jgi:TonB family protein
MAILLLSSLGMAQGEASKTDALDKLQVLALVASDVPHARVASLVVERGIVFEPDSIYVKLLQKAGADEGVITAVRVASRPADDASGESLSHRNGPLERDQILDLLQTGVGSDDLAQLVATRGIDFEPFDEYLHAYEVAGAGKVLVSALREAGHSTSTEATATGTPNGGGGEKPELGGAKGKHIRVAGEIEAAKLVSHDKPVYPPLARNARIQGAVRLQALIGTDGTVEDLKVLSGHPLLIKSAMDAVSQWRYQPTLVNGKPVKVETEIDVNYMLQ